MAVTIRKKDALDYHTQGRRGKIEVTPTKPLLTQRDLSLAYTPGVAEPCREIAKNVDRVYEYTARGNLVAVISDGTAVLGLGNIGPEAGKPVMEGKGVLFKRFADIDVFDIEIRVRDTEEFIRVVAALEPTFGGINLEDVKAPECFVIESALKQIMRIPVFHDDQHGTAIISGAALLNACELQRKDMASLRIVVSGAGASAIACAEHYINLGARRENMLLVDTKGVVYTGRTHGMNEYKARFAKDTPARTLADAMRGADMLLGCSVGGLVTKEMVASMNERPIIFAMANPDPEITYPDAISVRSDLIMATGRSDYPNQVNNVLGFPFIFRGALDCGASTINEEMKQAASYALAGLAKQEVPEAVSKAYGGAHFKFGPEYIIPKPFDQRVLWWEACAVARAAAETGVARIKLDLEEYAEQLKRRIGASHEVVRKVVTKAKAAPKRIVFAEGDEPAVLRACQILVDEGIARPILLGKEEDILAGARTIEHEELLGRVEMVNPQAAPQYERYVDVYWNLRNRKGVTREVALRHMMRRTQFGMMMVREGQADGICAGWTLEYPEVIRPALQIVGTRPGVRRAAGMYMMVFKNDVKFFADATINIDPDAETLADIAVQVADAVREFDLQPRVAMLSFSNFGSAPHPQTERVRRAVQLVRERRPDLEIDGEMQADVAVDYAELKDQFPFARLRDEANVLVFPDLASGNIAYKLVGRLGGAEAIGPIVLGVRKPVTVLARGCPVSTIVNMAAITVMKAQGEFDRSLLDRAAAAGASEGK